MASEEFKPLDTEAPQADAQVEPTVNPDQAAPLEQRVEGIAAANTQPPVADSTATGVPFAEGSRMVEEPPPGFNGSVITNSPTNFMVEAADGFHAEVSPEADNGGAPVEMRECVICHREFNPATREKCLSRPEFDSACCPHPVCNGMGAFPERNIPEPVLSSTPEEFGSRF